MIECNLHIVMVFTNIQLISNMQKKGLKQVSLELKTKGHIQPIKGFLNL